MIGAEYVELDTGARIAFSTRSASTGRGLAIDRLIVDEAEDLPAAEVGALQPTVYSRPRAQSLFFGTAPGPMHDSEAFATMRKSAHDGLNSRLGWAEWCAEFGDDIDDHAVWIRTNPAVATGRVPLQAIADDRAVLPPDTFRAERLSMWVPRAAGDVVFDAAVWEALTDPASVPVTDLAIGVDAGPSRDEATVCVAGRRADGRLHVEWYTTAPGVTWLPGWVAAHLGPRVRAVVVDERGALADLDWATVRVRPTLVGHREVAVAAGLLLDAVTDGTVQHRGQVELSRGVLSAKQRPMLGGQAFGWDRKAPGSSVLVAVSLALWGVACATRRAQNGSAGSHHLVAARRRRRIRRSGSACPHDCPMSKRAEYTFAFYSGSLAEPGDANPYRDKSLVLAKLWLRGYMRMLRVRTHTGPAMQRHLQAGAAAESCLG